MPFDLIAFRRDLHQHPELSDQESRTAAQVVAALAEAGIAAQTGIAGHGVVAVIEGAHPGPTLLYRADMDALPIQEASDVPYASCNAGVMHACGHDVHTTIGVGVALAIAARRAELHGRVKFVFQPAEEAAPPPGGTIGAEKMVDEGVLQAPAVDAALALHVMPLLEVGKLGWTGGAVWAASDLFDITVTGAMTHGAYPHEGIDPVVAAAAIIQAMQNVVSRRIDGREAAVVSVCHIQAGSAYNIVPSTVLMRGLIRTLDASVREKLLALLHTAVTTTATAHGCSATFDAVLGAHLTANDPALERRVCEAVAASGAGLEVVPFKAQMGAEDFSAFSRRVPGCYLFLGVRNEARGITHMIHTPRFDVDERCLALGTNAMVHALLHLGRTWNADRSTT